jgi:hypothetical protein
MLGTVQPHSRETKLYSNEDVKIYPFYTKLGLVAWLCYIAYVYKRLSYPIPRHQPLYRDGKFLLFIQSRFFFFFWEEIIRWGLCMDGVAKGRRERTNFHDTIYERRPALFFFSFSYITSSRLDKRIIHYHLLRFSFIPPSIEPVFIHPLHLFFFKCLHNTALLFYSPRSWFDGSPWPHFFHFIWIPKEYHLENVHIKLYSTRP